MIRLYQFLFQRMKDNFTDFDYSFLKLYGALFGAIVGAYFPEFIKSNLILFAGVFLLLLSRYIYVLFIKGDNGGQREIVS